MDGATARIARDYLMPIMTRDELAAVYRDYIACLNRRDWAVLGRFVDDGVRHNGRLR